MILGHKPSRLEKTIINLYKPLAGNDKSYSSIPGRREKGEGEREPVSGVVRGGSRLHLLVIMIDSASYDLGVITWLWSKLATEWNGTVQCPLDGYKIWPIRIESQGWLQDITSNLASAWEVSSERGSPQMHRKGAASLVNFGGIFLFCHDCLSKDFQQGRCLTDESLPCPLGRTSFMRIP